MKDGMMETQDLTCPVCENPLDVYVWVAGETEETRVQDLGPNDVDDAVDSWNEMIMRGVPVVIHCTACYSEMAFNED